MLCGVRKPGPFRLRGDQQCGGVEATPHFNSANGYSKRRRQLEAMTAAAKPGPLEIIAIIVGENLADQPAVGIDAETDRRFGMIRVLRPAGDTGFTDAVDITTQPADARSVGSAQESGAQGNTPPTRGGSMMRR
jgi:hypothetical protein